MKKNLMKKTVTTALCFTMLLGITSTTTALAGQSPTPNTYSATVDKGFSFKGQLSIRPSYNAFMGYIDVTYPNAVAMEIGSEKSQGDTITTWVSGYKLDTNPYFSLNVTAYLNNGETVTINKTLNAWDMTSGISVD